MFWLFYHLSVATDFGLQTPHDPISVSHGCLVDSQAYTVFAVMLER